MIHKIEAEWLYLGTGMPIPKGQVLLDHDGVVLEVGMNLFQEESLTLKCSGLVSPGFINAHCHLELSHMKGMVQTSQKLIPFIQEVVTKRDAPQTVINAAIVSADHEMWDNGIMAVGDISNTADTFDCKRNSKIKYHTFVEYFDLLNPDWTQRSIEQYDKVYFNAPNSNGNRRTAVPHAPYSVTPALFNHINHLNSESKRLISLHNQETAEEDRLFKNGDGDFRAFYEKFGNHLTEFRPIHQSSIHYTAEYLSSSDPLILVHNTRSEVSDIQFASDYFDHLYWCTCPNANIYIEDTLPDYSKFSGQTMVIGTDSLTSNWQLSIIKECETIQKYQKIDSFTLLEWATSNGARALAYDELGEIKIGKKPGLIQLNHFNKNGAFSFEGSSVKRLI